MRFYVTKARPTIMCSTCGVLEEAGPTYLNGWFVSVDAVRRAVDAEVPDIPVGWSSNGWKGNRRDLRCATCTN